MISELKSVSFIEWVWKNSERHYLFCILNFFFFGFVLVISIFHAGFLTIESLNPFTVLL